MGQTFPSALPNYPDTTPSEVLGNLGGGKGLSTIVDDYGLDITALGTKMGTGAATPTANQILVGSGLGTSTWSSTLSGLTFVAPALGTPASGVMTNVTGLPEAGQTLADNTTNNVSTSKHGYVPKAPNVTTKFLRADATWSNALQQTQLAIAVSAPVDATTYYDSYFVGGATSEPISRVLMAAPGTITACYLAVYGGAGTVSSNETSSIWIRQNNTTDTVITSALTTSDASRWQQFSNTGLSIVVVAGDYIALKWTTPTWATNPGGTVVITATILMT